MLCSGISVTDSKQPEATKMDVGQMDHTGSDVMPQKNSYVDVERGV